MERPRLQVIAVAALLAVAGFIATTAELRAEPAASGANRRSKVRASGAKKRLNKRPKGTAVRGRTIDPNHPLRRQVGPDALLRATVALMSHGDLNQVPRHVRRALSKLARKPQRALKSERVQRSLVEVLRRRLGTSEYEAVVGGQAAGLKLAAQGLDDSYDSDPKRDRGNMNRGWGWQLLPRNDRAFSDPTFLTNMLRNTGATGTGLVENDPVRAHSLFMSAWQKIAPSNTRPVSFTLTGSDANNALYDIALVAAQRRLGKDLQNVEMLHFDGIYGGGRGRVGGKSFLGYGKQGAPKADDFAIVSPHGHKLKPQAKAEIKRLEAIETQALQQIRDKVENGKTPIGGLLMEPILGAKGVMFYRPEFLLKLRALCDELKIPIMADEILTGGGRTGKFFGYEHYEGFQPDFVTFGKGLQVAGVAQVSRGRDAPRYEAPRGMVTLQAHVEPLLKGAQIMTRIHDGKLMDNAARVGKSIVRTLQNFEKDKGIDVSRDGPSRGIGLLIYTRRYASSVRDAMGRLMPYMTISKQEAAELINEKTLSR